MPGPLLFESPRDLACFPTPTVAASSEVAGFSAAAHANAGWSRSDESAERAGKEVGGLDFYAAYDIYFLIFTPPIYIYLIYMNVICDRYVCTDNIYVHIYPLVYLVRAKVHMYMCTVY